MLVSCVSANNEPVVMGDAAVPMHLTEADAFQIVSSEAKKVGMHLVEKGRHIKLRIPLDGGKTTKEISYRIDGIDPKTGIGYDYVTQENCRAVYGKSTAVEPKELAKTIEDNLAGTKLAKKVKVIPQPQDDDPGVLEPVLRKEIVSFFKWLKAQGVI